MKSLGRMNLLDKRLKMINSTPQVHEQEQIVVKIEELIMFFDV